LVLTGANTYTGGTTINAGTLQLGDGTTNGSIIGNVTNNSVLAFNPAAAQGKLSAPRIAGANDLHEALRRLPQAPQWRSPRTARLWG
jgi:fibronectin-binding autotransporter adhesin